MSKVCRTLFWVLPFLYLLRTIGLDDRGDTPPPPPVTGLEFTIWAMVAVGLSQIAMNAVSGTEKKIIGILSWVLTCVVVCIWVIPYEMNTPLKLSLLALLFGGWFFPISNVTTWRPWGHLK